MTLGSQDLQSLRTVQASMLTVAVASSAQHRRRDAEQNLQMLFREMLDAVALHEIICDKNGKPSDYRFLAANPAFETITGLEVDHIIGRTVLDALPDVEAWWIDTYGQVALGGKPMHFEHYSRELGRQFAVTVFSPASRRSDSEMVAANLSRLLDRAFELAVTDLDLRGRCDLRAIPVIRDYAPDLRPVSAVVVEIEQVLLNLIVNAAQAMAELPEGTPARLELRTFVEEGFAAAEVVDNGPGMTADVRRRIFEPFFTTKPPGRGTGLGLAVAFAIVTQHHQGRIDVESQPGCGTRVTVRLPSRPDGVARNTEDHHG